MPTDIKLKNSVTATNAPSSLQQGEVAINITDKKVWVGNAATTPVQLLGTGSDATFTNISVIGTANFADGVVTIPSITNIGDTNTGIFFPAADTIAFTEGGVESMRIDQNGRLGIGTTSLVGRVASATDAYSSFTAMAGSVGAGLSVKSLVSTDFGGANFANAIYDALSHQWQVASSGQMYLTSAGNLGLGVSSPVTRLDVSGPASVTSFTGTTRLGVTVRGSSGGTDYSGIDFIGNSQTQPLARIAVLSTGSGSLLQFGTSNSYGSGITNTAMTIDSSGNLGIGISSPGARLDISSASGTIFRCFTSGVAQVIIGNGGASSNFYDGDTQIFRSGNATERMRIDSSGRLLVGLTSWAGGATNAGVAIKSTSNSSSIFAFYIDNTSSNILNVRCDGSTYNTTGVWGTISDQRLKENIVDATPKLDNLLQLKVRNFNFTSDENKTKQIGFVAQEIEQVFPSLVSEDAEGTKAVKTTVLLPMLVKAIQEQQALIENLTTRLNALEGK
jgi:hypothetical protein